ncbi:MAG: adenylate/guanylate cyclase domain-containing protein [bacterium]|nr:adenylate/guanylate cyclase domain-containing protein [bacterium]
MRFDYILGIVCFSLLITSLHADDNYIVKATQKGITVNQYSKILQDPDANQISCKTKRINQFWAFPANCLQNINSVIAHGKKAHGVRIEYWREQNDHDAEYNLAYTSKIGKNTSIKLFTTYNQPKKKWISQDIYLPDLNFINGKATLNFHTNDVAIFKYIKKLRNPDSPHITNFSDPSRYKIKPFYPLSNIYEHQLFNNHTIWIHKIEWFLDSFTEQKAVNTEYLKKIKSTYRTFFERTEHQLILAILFIVGLGISLWAVTRYLQIQLMSSLIMPTTLIIIFMANPMIEYFDSLEEIKLQRIRGEIETVYKNIKQTQSLSMHQIHQRIVKQKKLLLNSLNSTHFKDLLPAIKPNANYRQVSLHELTQEVLRLRQNEKEQLLEQIMTHLGKNLYNFYLPIIELKYSLHDDKKHLLLDRDYLEQEYLGLIYKNSPISQTLRYLEVTTGLDLKLSNGKCVLEAHTFNKGFKNQSGIEAPLMSQLLHNIRRTPEETSQLDENHRQAIIDLSEKINKLGINPQFISDFMNEPHEWHEIGSSRKNDTIKLYSWQLIDTKNGPWVLLINMNLGTLLKEMNLLIKEKSLYQLTFKATSKSGLLDNFKKHEKQNLDMDYFFLGEKNRESFPLDKNNSYLSRAASIASLKQTPIMLPVNKNQRDYIALGFPMFLGSAYSLAIGREVSSDWQTLLELKSRIQWFIFILILSPLILATNIAGRITRPLKQMGEAVFKIARGQYQTELKLTNIDEFSNLALQFNRMSIALQKGEELTSFISNESLHDILKTNKSSNREEVTILFCGLHNFHDYHEVDPALAQKYFENFILINQTIINLNKGIVDKFTGIAILAIFRDSNKQKRALKSAEAIKHSILKFNEKSEIPFKIGIGIASGSVILGQVGATNRKDFTCIGNTVNMAARLEALSSNSNSQITTYLDESTVIASVELDIQIKELTPTKIKGKKELQKVYELVSIQ